MRLKKWNFGVLVFVTLFSVNASAASFSIVGAVTDGLANATSSGSSLKGGIGYGGGVLGDFYFGSPMVAFEPGALFLVSNFTLGTPGNSSSSSVTSLYVPLVARVMLSRHFSFSVGGYTNYYFSSGDADYGVEAGLRFSHFKWFIEARLSEGLKTFTGDVRYSNVMVMLGIHLH